jgi:superfamily II DNA/RNA helicase
MRTLDIENRIIKQWLSSSSSSFEDVLVSPRIRWGAVDVVVTTPSKFVTDMKRFSDQQLKPSTIVFDEADLLFQREVIEIIDYLRPRKRRESDTPLCQCIFASATIPSIGPFSVGTMISQKFSTAEIIRAGNFHGLPSTIRRIEWIEESKGDWDERCYMLTTVLADPIEKRGERVIVFVNSTKNSQILHKYLSQKNWPVYLFNKTHVDDRSVFDDQANSGGQVLIATDLAARGIDWEKIDLVVNFQMPRDVVTWIHRGGRCGRIGEPGSIVTFFKSTEADIVNEIKRNLAYSFRAVDVMAERTCTDLSSLFSRKRSLRRSLKQRKLKEGRNMDVNSNSVQ